MHRLSGAKIVLKKLMHHLHSVDSILRNGAHRAVNCVGISPLRNNVMQIGLPDSVAHKATVRLENGWMTAKYTDDADPTTVCVIAASGVEPRKIPAPSLD
ncbi:hypothetical protein Tcan_15843 [Toxocara canis]|uniref:Uncharacterized protein n=1 Tax=Toxocara canis TaxID=6265 RepID=A0A0B2UTM5_TOXCA|nr:hypothetical protein Tcan_15843 [Toxocara canis]